MAEAAKATTKADTKKHPGGRPTKLTKAVIAAAKEYLDENDRLGPGALLPTIERLALNLGVHRDTLQEWEKTSTEFSVILERLRASQADKLVQNGLAGRYNSTIAKMLLSAKHGYVEQSRVEQENRGEQKIIVETRHYDPTSGD